MIVGLELQAPQGAEVATFSTLSFWYSSALLAFHPFFLLIANGEDL